MTRSQDQLAGFELMTRSGLPEDLRILLKTCPRDEWRGHANFDGLTEFWLERHSGFRELLSRIRGETESVLSDDLDASTFGRRLHRYGSLFVSQLHEHHNVEDVHYFPLLLQCDRRLARGFEILDRDHGVLDGELHRFTEDTNAVLSALRADSLAKDALSRFGDAISTFEGLLDRHLLDEEEIVIPVILEHRRVI